MNSSRTHQVLRQRGIAIAGGGLVLQLLATLTLLNTALFWGVQKMDVYLLGITLLLLLGTAGSLAASYFTLNDKTTWAVRLQAATVVGAGISCVMLSSVGTFLIVLIGAVSAYVGTKQLAAGLGR